MAPASPASTSAGPSPGFPVAKRCAAMRTRNSMPVRKCAPCASISTDSPTTTGDESLSPSWWRDSPHEPHERAGRLRQALPRALLQGHGRREADLHPRDGPEERGKAHDRGRPRARGGQPDARRRDARHQPEHAAEEDAAAADQGLVSRISRALLSVSDKAGIVELARALQGLGVQILSTGGTAALLQKESVPVTEVATYTGFPEMLDGRVKTLHPKIHGGLLAKREDPAHLQAIARAGIEPIDLLVVNLYPFEATVADPECRLEDAIENIDIGGPAMLRSAAKNHAAVAVVVDPGDYESVLQELRAQGNVSPS